MVTEGSVICHFPLPTRKDSWCSHWVTLLIFFICFQWLDKCLRKYLLIVYILIISKVAIWVHVFLQGSFFFICTNQIRSTFLCRNWTICWLCLILIIFLVVVSRNVCTVKKYTDLRKRSILENGWINVKYVCMFYSILFTWCFEVCLFYTTIKILK